MHCSVANALRWRIALVSSKSKDKSVCNKGSRWYCHPLMMEQETWGCDSWTSWNLDTASSSRKSSLSSLYETFLGLICLARYSGPTRHSSNLFSCIDLLYLNNTYLSNGLSRLKRILNPASSFPLGQKWSQLMRRLFEKGVLFLKSLLLFQLQLN